MFNGVVGHARENAQIGKAEKYRQAASLYELYRAAVRMPTQDSNIRRL